MNERLYRSRDDRMLAGVAGGLAEMWDADPSLVRIVWALLVFVTGGFAFLVREWLPAFDFDFFWPLALVGLGIVVLVIGFNRDSGGGGTAS